MRKNFKTDRPFHGDYLKNEIPGQGKRPDQYKYSAFVMWYVLAIVLSVILFAGLFAAGEWLWNLVTGV